MPDLTDISGIPELWSHTHGDPRITIAVLDGPADLDRACFAGADLTRASPYWARDIDLDPRYLELFLEIENSGESDERQRERKEEGIPDELARERLHLGFHATHVVSTILGQPGSPVQGVAPRCRGINIPLGYHAGESTDSVNFTRAIDLALDLGVNIIHVALCQTTSSGIAHDLVDRAIRRCRERNVLIVAPGGNDKGECWCIPAILPDVLTVGAMKDSGEPFKFSNWGRAYQTQGVLANGENILGAQPGTDRPIRKKGTSCAAPIVTGVAALLMSLQLKRGAAVDAEAVRAAIVNSAVPCNPDETPEPERCLRGRLSVPDAYALITGEALSAKPEVNASIDRLPDHGVVVSESAGADAPNKPTGLAYVLGTLGYDFGTEARRDTFQQLMVGVTVEGAPFATEPYDPRQMSNYLAANPSEAKSLIWTLNLESTPVYAIEPVGPFAAEVYRSLQRLMAAQTQPQDSAGFIERMSICGFLTKREVRLFSGQVVQVLATNSPRGMYGWTVAGLATAAAKTVQARYPDASEQVIERGLKSFLERVYYDLRNAGLKPRDRALNFAATNVLQASWCIADPIGAGMQLDSVELEKSPFCRRNSDCWDIKLKFFDPENKLRARKVFRFTIDVSDALPVTVGALRSWSVAQ